MRPRLEQIQFGDAAFLVFERRESLTPFWHYHPEFQITLMVDGEGRRFIGNGISDYGPGDLVLIGSNLPHTWKSRSEQLQKSRNQYTIDVQFRSEFLADSLFLADEFKPVTKLLKRSRSGLAFGHTVAGRRAGERLSTLPSLSGPHRALAILDSLLELAMATDPLPLSVPSSPERRAMNSAGSVEEICGYLAERYDQEINFCAVSRRFDRSQASLCHFFKRATGRTMTAFVNELRVNAAARMLLEERRGLAEVAFSVGFGNYSHFNHQFKKIKGVSPIAWRKRN